MKKLISIALCAVMLLGVFCAMASCSKESYEIAVVTDVGQINDKGFNQGTWEGAEAYAKKNNISVKYYQPANGSDANDNDRIAAMRQAINNGAKVIVTPGYLQATALRTVAAEHPEVIFVFVDGWTITDKVDETGKEVGTPFANITQLFIKSRNPVTLQAMPLSRKAMKSWASLPAAAEPTLPATVSDMASFRAQTLQLLNSAKP